MIILKWWERFEGVGIFEIQSERFMDTWAILISVNYKRIQKYTAGKTFVSLENKKSGALRKNERNFGLNGKKKGHETHNYFQCPKNEERED